MATHPSIPAQRIPQTEEPSGPQSTGSQRDGHNGATKHVPNSNSWSQTSVPNFSNLSFPGCIPGPSSRLLTWCALYSSQSFTDLEVSQECHFQACALVPLYVISPLQIDCFLSSAIVLQHNYHLFKVSVITCTKCI